MREGSLPIRAQLCEALPEGVPVWSHADLPRSVGVGDHAAHAHIVAQFRSHAAHAGARADTVLRVHHHIGGNPLRPFLVHADFTNRNLPIAHIVQHFRCALDSLIEISQESAIVARVPFQAEVKVKEQQRVIRCHVQRLHAQCSHRMRIQPRSCGHAAGIVKRIRVGRPDGCDSHKPVSQMQLTPSLEIALSIGEVRLPRIVGIRGCTQRPILEVKNLRFRHRLCALHNANLISAHAERISSCCGVGPLIRSRHAILNRGKIGVGDDTEDDVVGASEKAAGIHIPGIDLQRARGPG